MARRSRPECEYHGNPPQNKNRPPQGPAFLLTAPYGVHPPVYAQPVSQKNIEYFPSTLGTEIT
jgi:hypothetical protein